MLAPACSRPTSSTRRLTPCNGGGTSPCAIRSANPSTTAVLPTPASPVRIGLFWRRRISTSITWRISPSRPVTGSILPSRARSVRSTANFPSASCLPMGAGAMAPLASPGVAAPSVAGRAASGLSFSTSGIASARSSGFTRSHWRLMASMALRRLVVRRTASSRCAVRTWFTPNISVANTQARSIASSMAGLKSWIDVAPRGRRSSAAVRSAARRDGSRSKCLTMRCRSLSGVCRIWCSQCTISTYGLPRSLQNTVAPSMAR